MRVLLYYPRAFTGDGGMTGAVQRLAVGMAALGVDVTVAFDDGAEDHDAQGVHWCGVPHGGRGRFRACRDPDRAVRDADVVVVHSAWTLANVVMARAARRRAVPYVIAPRGAYDPMIVHRHRLTKLAWWWLAERMLVTAASAIHVFFESELAHLRALGFRGRVIVAPNGVEAPPGVRWDGGSGGYVLWMGRFDPQHKGIDVLLEAVALLPPSQRPLLRLHGPDWRGKKERVRETVRSLGIDPWVSVAEQLRGPAKWRALSQARGFVYPSRWEGFGNSLAEAAAIGVPALGTPYPLARYLAERGAVFLAPPTAAGLADGLHLLTSTAAREVGRAGETVARRDLSWSAVAGAWAEQLAAVT
ncbi:MAG: glycosyltransferase [Chloroflexota bacterium]|nr:glycosyltransferase [Chloroflexota bacterium]